uniref:Uncharacterized protein n=1 Tax=Arundo donax TaxID=35708 RepID=A0A0A9EUB2_ARUDO
MHSLEQFCTVYALACHQRGCCLLQHKWPVVVAEVWGLGVAFLIAQTPDWPAIDLNSITACLLSHASECSYPIQPNRGKIILQFVRKKAAYTYKTTTDEGYHGDETMLCFLFNVTFRSICFLCLPSGILQL